MEAKDPRGDASLAGERTMEAANSDAAGQPAASWRTSLPEPALARLRRQLEALERDLRTKIDDERHRARDEAQLQREAVGDLVDRAFVTVQATMERDLIDRCVTQLDEIARTHDRITNGEIGICLDCHEPIESRRLQANPVASRCTECQMLHEKEAWINAR